MIDLPVRAVRKWRFGRAQLQLLRDFTRVMQAGPPARVGAGPVIGFAAFGSGGWHFVIEALLAHALAARGARPALLMCDLPDLPICDERTIHSRHRERCDGCYHDKRTLVAASGLPWRGLSSLVDDATLLRARTTVAVLADHELTAHRERGWPVGQWLHVSACHYLRCDARGDEPEKVDTRRRLLTTAIVAVAAVERWLDETRPEIVVVESGAHLVWRVAFELARGRGLSVVCREMGKGGWDRHLYALNADSMAPDLTDAWASAQRQELSSDEALEVERFLQELPQHTYRQDAAVARATPESLRSKFGIAAGARVAVAFTNVTWDLATAGRDVGFSGVRDWLIATIRTLRTHPSVHLIVRAHPAEASVLTRERILDQLAVEWPEGLPGVTLVPPEDTTSARDVCQVASLVLAYNSSVAIEAAADGHPVVVAGRPHYRGKGFTIDVSSRDEYRALLAQWADGATTAAPAGVATLARRYAHLFFLRYHVPMGWTTSPLEPPYRLRITSRHELEPGRNAALDSVCDGLLAHRQIVLPRRGAGTSS
jgi:hypothetical protein